MADLCRWCDQVALYRMPQRCKKHKEMTCKSEVERRQRFELKATEIEKKRLAADYAQLQTRQSRRGFRHHFSAPSEVIIGRP